VFAPTDYSDNKIGDSTGNATHFLVVFGVFPWPFSLALPLFHFYQSLSLQGTLIDSLGPEVPYKFLSFSQILPSFIHSRTKPFSCL
jgi:hypothetical protein